MACGRHLGSMWWQVDGVWLVCAGRVEGGEGVWLACGCHVVGVAGVCRVCGRCLGRVPGTGSTADAKPQSFPLWQQLRGESRRPWLAFAEGLLAGRLLQSFSRVPEWPGLGCHCRQRSLCLVSDHTVKSAGGPLCPVSVTDTIAYTCHWLPPLCRLPSIARASPHSPYSLSP